jgi:hypothetical protein
MEIQIIILFYWGNKKDLKNFAACVEEHYVIHIHKTV